MATTKIAITCIAGKEPKKRIRAFHSKSRLGCLVCKTGRLKCDEDRPQCGRCKKRGIACRYQAPIHNALSILLTPKELRSLQFYREQTSHHLAGHFEQDFWTSIVLKLSYTNDTLQHFLVALGSLDESFGLRNKGPGQQYHAASLYAFSIEQYNMAVQGVIRDRQLQSMPTLILTSCIASVLYEMWLGSHENARKHAMHGSQIQLQLCNSEQVEIHNEHDSILESYLKPIVARNSYQLSANPGSDRPPESLAQVRFSADKNIIFTTSADSKEQFRILSASLVSRAEKIAKMQANLHRAVEQQKLLNELDSWYKSFVALPRGSDTESTREFDLLSVKYHSHRIAISCAPYNNERVYDNHLSDHQAIVKLCADFLESHKRSSQSYVIRSHDTSTCMALITVGCYCRDPVVRREAIKLLYRYPRLEGIWMSPMMGFFAEMMMRTEEEGLVVQSCGDVPAERRARIFQMIYIPGYLDDDAVDADPKTNPPFVSLIYTRQNSSDPSALHYVMVPLKRYHIASGFGDKSASWWPRPAVENLLMDQMIPDSFRHKDGPMLGHKGFWVSESTDIGAHCNMTHWTLNMNMNNAFISENFAGP